MHKNNIKVGSSYEAVHSILPVESDSILTTYPNEKPISKSIVYPVERYQVNTSMNFTFDKDSKLNSIFYSYPVFNSKKEYLKFLDRLHISKKEKVHILKTQKSSTTYGNTQSFAKTFSKGKDKFTVLVIKDGQNTYYQVTEYLK